MIGVEPNESCTLMCGEVGRHLIEGISDGFVPGIIERHRDQIDDLVPVDSEPRSPRCAAGPRVRPVRRAELRGNLVAARAWRDAIRGRTRS